jgi:hypothetical protein
VIVGANESVAAAAARIFDEFEEGLEPDAAEAAEAAEIDAWLREEVALNGAAARCETRASSSGEVK